ncbi:hypothetical protein [Rhodococcoides kyotonense]|uniref:Lipoprotein n=1 Tax=Rhodococcoides kyotonense TaxID=398843 RepID=A0A239J538_9NOCA|nr:hypothetical protein [Rhodococcus kyotonensis]SNS99764.1 hypothetical protein SAMN05421642_1088 [Rhodococcus kyotonensis]
MPNRSSAIIGSLLVMAFASACTIGTGDSPSVEARYPVPTTPNSDGQGTFVKFESGLSGSGALAADKYSKCRANSEGSRAFRAATSDFAPFDRGSASPGTDFDLEVLLNPSSVRNAAGERTDYLLLKFVDRDGIHHTLTVLDRLEIQVANDGIGFSATSHEVEPESPVPISFTGFVKCTEVEDVSGPI